MDNFELMFSPDYAGARKYNLSYNKEGIIEISVDGYTFIPDLQFMNGFAVCRYCGSINNWDYSKFKRGEYEENIKKK